MFHVLIITYVQIANKTTAAIYHMNIYRMLKSAVVLFVPLK